MDNRNMGYGNLLTLLRQMLQGSRMVQNAKQSLPSETADDSSELQNEERFFTADETEARWRKELRLELLTSFCREGYAMARRHGHFLIGTGETGSFIAIPGRFLLEEQPAGGVTGFTLWQPLAGGEDLYESLEELEGERAETVYGYWIARLDPDSLKLSEV